MQTGRFSEIASQRSRLCKDRNSGWAFGSRGPSRTHTTLANELGMAFSDRMAMMGHSEARMTALYTVEDLERRRMVLDQMAERLLTAAIPAPTPAAV